MANKHQLKEVRVKWAKIIGKPQKGYNDGPEQWAFDAFLNKDQVKELKALGLGPKIKDKGEGPFIQFKRKAKEVVKQDGTKTLNYIPIFDHHNNPWGGALIGNDSILNVSFMVNQRPGYKGAKPTMAADVLAVQVWDLVEYHRPSDFEVKDTSSVTDASEDSRQEQW